MVEGGVHKVGDHDLATNPLTCGAKVPLGRGGAAMHTHMQTNTSPTLNPARERGVLSSRAQRWRLARQPASDGAWR